MASNHAGLTFSDRRLFSFSIILSEELVIVQPKMCMIADSVIIFMRDTMQAKQSKAKQSKANQESVQHSS